MEIIIKLTHYYKFKVFMTSIVLFSFDTVYICMLTLNLGGNMLLPLSR